MWPNLQFPNLGFEAKFSGKPFMYIKKSSGPRIERWGTTASTFVHAEYWTLRITFCFLSLRKLVKVFNKSPATPFYPKSINKTFMPNFVKSFRYISRKTLYWYISCVIDINWFVHESPSLKPDWFGEIKSFSIKYSNRLLYTIVY